MGSTSVGGKARSPYLFWLAAALTVTLIGAFTRTFFLQPLFSAKPLTVAMIFHGICGTAWFLMLVRQAWLAHQGRMAEHVQAGRYGALLAILAILSALMVIGATAMDGKMSGSGLPESTALLIQLSTTAWFTLLVTLGFHMRRKPEVHKRLMILATITMMAPAFSRISRLFRDGGPPVIDSAWLASIFIAALVIYDVRRSGRLHRVTLIVGLAYLMWVAVRMPIGRSSWWTDLVTPFLTGG